MDDAPIIAAESGRRVLATDDFPRCVPS